MPRLLDLALCAALEDRLRDQGAAIVDVLRPGLSDKEMDRLTSEVGIDLPHEARVWWGWHDGAGELGAINVWQPPELELGPGISLLPMQDAVGHCRRMRELCDSIDPDVTWPRSWLAISDVNADAIVLHCGGSRLDPVPVEAFTPEAGFDSGPDLVSMGDMVEIWIGAIDCGGWRYDRELERWEYDRDRLLPGLRDWA